MSEREVIERLDRIAVAAEKAAARLWWIALPIYLTVAMLIAWVLLVVLPVLAIPAVNHCSVEFHRSGCVLERWEQRRLPACLSSGNNAKPETRIRPFRKGGAARWTRQAEQ